MNTDYFIYITGVVSFTGLVLQIFNVFQRYKNIRNSISFILLGVFVGSIISKFEPNTIKFNIAIDGYMIVVTLFIIVILTSLVVGLINRNKIRKKELFTVSGIAFAFFLIILFFGSIPTLEKHELEMKKLEMNNLSIEELIYIADENEKKHNLDRAIIHLEMIKSRLKQDDPRYEVVDERIKKVKLKQVE